MTSVVTSQRVTDRFGIKHVTPAATTSANLPNYGVSLIASTGAYVIDNPVVGTQAIIAVTALSTETSTVATASTTVTFASSSSSSTGGDNTLTFDAAGEAVTLVGASTQSWVVVSNSGSVAQS